MKKTLFSKLPRPGDDPITHIAREQGWVDGERPGSEYQERWFFNLDKGTLLSAIFSEFKARWPDWYFVTAQDHGDHVEVWGELII